MSYNWIIGDIYNELPFYKVGEFIILIELRGIILPGDFGDTGGDYLSLF